MRLLDRDLWQEVTETLGRNKRRSIVTAFGVFWGLLMLIVLLSVSSGFKNGIDHMTQGVAANSAVIYASNTSKPYAGFKAGRSWRLLTSDIDIVRSRVPGVKAIAGVTNVWSWGEDNLSFGGKRARANLSGITSQYFEAIRVKLLAGRMLSERDHREVRKYCLLGQRPAEQLFGSDPAQAIGKVVKAGRAYYTVVGVVTSINSAVNIGSSPEASLYLPYEVINITENKGGRLNNMAIVGHDGVDMTQLIEDVSRVLKELKQIAPEDKVAVSNFNISQMFRMFAGINIGINILVWIVGVGTLLTGVVGISNILLVTVRERTQEIGVRRALGAKPRDIIGQLLLEGVSLTTIAGLLGLVLGVGVSSILAAMADNMWANNQGGSGLPFYNPTVDLGIAILAFVIIILSGLVAGILPALKAIEVKAIEAIREE